MVQYSFIPVTQCNMCQTDIAKAKKLGFRLNKSQGYNPNKLSGVAVSVMQCTSCKLIYNNPQPIPDSVEKQYDVDPNEYWNEEELPGWDESYMEQEIKILKSLQKPKPGLKALDVGAGYGRCMLSLKEAGYDTYGFEPSKNFYNLAINKFGIPKDRIQLSTMEDIDFPNESFDFISFGAVLEHLHDPDECLKRALTWLKPNGIIHIEVPSSKWLITKIYNFYFQWIRGTRYVTNTSPMHPPFHHYEFSDESFEKNGKINNYSVVFKKVFVCSVMLPTRIFDGLLKKYMEYTDKGMELVVFLKKH